MGQYVVKCPMLDCEGAVAGPTSYLAGDASDKMWMWECEEGIMQQGYVP
jgi:hypothetical protein